MLATLASILAIGGQVVADAPQVLAIIEAAIAAFHANDQASLDKANVDARALADSLKPAGA